MAASASLGVLLAAGPRQFRVSVQGGVSMDPEASRWRLWEASPAASRTHRGQGLPVDVPNKLLKAKGYL